MIWIVNFELIQSEFKIKARRSSACWREKEIAFELKRKEHMVVPDLGCLPSSEDIDAD